MPTKLKAKVKGCMMRPLDKNSMKVYFCQGLANQNT